MTTLPWLAAHNGDRQRELGLEVIDALMLLEGRFTELVEMFHGAAVNQCLLTGLYTLDADGIITHSFSVPFGSLVIGNLGTARITVATGPPQRSAPANGPGAHAVPAGSGAVLRMADRVLTIYGNPGDQVNVAVYTGALPPSYAGSPAQGTVGAASVLTPVAVTGADQLITNVANANLGGFALAEPTGLADTKLYLRNGTTAAGTSLVPIVLAPGESTSDFTSVQGMRFANGIFLDVVRGTVEGSIWLGSPA